MAVAVAFSSYFPKAEPVAVAISIPAPPKAQRAIRKPWKAVAPPMYIPVTGASLGLLASCVYGTVNYHVQR